MFRLTLRTFHRVYPEMAVFYPQSHKPIHYVLLVGWKDHMQFDFRRFVEMVAETDVQADLADIYYDNPFKLLSSFVTSAEQLKAYLAGDVVKTQDLPILEFEAPKRGYQTGEIEYRNLRRLLEHRTSAKPWIVPATMSDKQQSRHTDYEHAMEMTLRGQFFEMVVEIERACVEYLGAADLLPNDRGLKKALEFEWLETFAHDGDGIAWGLLGRSLQLQKRPQEALEHFDRCEHVLATTSTSPHQPHVAAGFRRKLRLWREQALAEMKDTR